VKLAYREMFMALFWRPQLRVGHDGIDHDHRHLILLINTVELVMRYPEHPENLRLALNDLYGFAVQHFGREERIQLAHGYIHSDDHRKEHKRLLSVLDSMINQPDMVLGVLTPTQTDEIAAFLRQWLVDHVVKADLRMVYLFRK